MKRIALTMALVLLPASARAAASLEDTLKYLFHDANVVKILNAERCVVQAGPPVSIFIYDLSRLDPAKAVFDQSAGYYRVPGTPGTSEFRKQTGTGYEGVSFKCSTWDCKRTITAVSYLYREHCPSTSLEP